jgi:hypothetical protein
MLATNPPNAPIMNMTMPGNSSGDATVAPTAISAMPVTHPIVAATFASVVREIILLTTICIYKAFSIFACLPHQSKHVQ